MDNEPIQPNHEEPQTGLIETDSNQIITDNIPEVTEEPTIQLNEEQAHKNKNASILGVCMCIGIAVGVFFLQLLFHDLIIGVAVGLGLGTLIGKAIGAQRDRAFKEQQ